jgi:hypothetical protein
MLYTLKKYYICLPFICISLCVYAQKEGIDSVYKASPYIQHQLTANTTWASAVLVSVVTNNVDSLLAFCRNNSITVKAVYKPAHIIQLSCSFPTLKNKLINNPLVQFVNEKATPTEETSIYGFDNSVNKINTTHAYWPAINGKGISFSVKENLIDTVDIDFAGRYFPTSLASAFYTNTHSTIMATIIGGAGNSNYTAKGVAWGAGISSSSFASLLPDVDADYRQYSLSVQNHSYGTIAQNYYGAEALAYDVSANNNPSLLHVFSAGNKGLDIGTGYYSGLAAVANLTGNFKMAKNILAVGAYTSNTQNVSILSSKGPAYDGRVKPELIALGEDGSSGAAALVSGTAVLLQHQYKTQTNTLPAAALVKAILINSADDVGNPGIDFSSGYGNLNAFKAMNILQHQQFFESNVSDKQQTSFFINIPPNIQQLKATLVWNDPAAIVNAPKALVNDLDLTITEQATNNTWQPWVLNSFANINSLQTLPIRAKDSSNNTEQISINYPTAGVYTLQVSGYAVPSGSQNFSIAYQLDTLDTFVFTFPVQNDNLLSNSINTLRWQNTFDTTQPGTLEVNLNNNSWQLITDQLQLGKGFYEWLAPNTTGICNFRITVGQQVFVSNPATISAAPIASVGFACADSFMIYWNKIPGIQYYQVYELGNQYLQPATLVADSFVIFKKINYPDLYYSVAPVVASSIVGAKANAINYTTQGVGCYIKTFLADGVNQTAELKLEIGTTYLVKYIVFEQWENSQFVALKTLDVVTGNNFYTYTDSSLTNGANKYRAKIVFESGAIIYSNIETVWNLAANQFFIYPNPVTIAQPLHVLSKDTRYVSINIVDMCGRIILDQPLTNHHEQLYLPFWAKGVYFYIIYKSGVQQQQGTITVL